MKALFTEEFHPVIYEKLQANGVECYTYANIDYDGLSKIISDYDILVVNSKIQIDKSIIDKAENLKIIGRVGSGLDIIDLEYCKKKNILVLSSPEGNANAVAEHTLGMLLSMMNNLFISNNQILNNEWVREENRGEELYGKTIGIIGCGHVGSRLAKLLENFNLTVLVNDIRKVEGQFKQVKLDEIFEKCHIVSLHIPLNNSTQFIANSQFFESFKKPIYFVNTSRGRIVDTIALLDALENGMIKKAMLDVFEEEPLTVKSSRFVKYLQEFKLICSPHIAGWSQRSKYELSNILADKILSKI